MGVFEGGSFHGPSVVGAGSWNGLFVEGFGQVEIHDLDLATDAVDDLVHGGGCSKFLEHAVPVWARWQVLEHHTWHCGDADSDGGAGALGS